jgi:hypothetical protein
MSKTVSCRETDQVSAIFGAGEVIRTLAPELGNVASIRIEYWKSRLLSGHCCRGMVAGANQLGRDWPALPS